MSYTIYIKGARLEVEIAKALNLQIGYVEDCIK